MNRWASLARCVGIVVGLSVLYAVLPFDGQRRWLGAAIALAALVAVVPVVLHLSRAVLVARHPVQLALESTALLVAMIVVGFSAAYVVIDDQAGQFHGLDTRLDGVYFTVTTLSTVGFGDVVAAGQAARAAVTLQILFDFSVLALAFRLLATAARRALVHEQRAEGS